MITVRTKGYCENCGRFEPYIKKRAYPLPSYPGDPYYQAYNTTISCKHEQCCETIALYLQEFPVEENKR